LWGSDVGVALCDKAGCASEANKHRPLRQSGRLGLGECGACRGHVNQGAWTTLKTPSPDAPLSPGTASYAVRTMLNDSPGLRRYLCARGRRCSVGFKGCFEAQRVTQETPRSARAVGACSRALPTHTQVPGRTVCALHCPVCTHLLNAIPSGPVRREDSPEGWGGRA
jgi:hypothetical protein